MSTKIAWTDETWNPVVGCTKVSAGCKNCYAERMAYRLGEMGKEKYQGLNYSKVQPGVAGQWTGEVYCDESALEKPLHWKKPRRIMVPSMGDLFHPSVPFEFIDKVMIVIANCKQHTFQILTKRPERMLQYFKDFPKEISRKNETFDNNFLKKDLIDKLQNHRLVHRNFSDWPPENLWLGVTAENQEMADKRIPILLQIPAAVRFVSVEPMLGPVDMRMIMMPTSKPNGSAPYDCLRGTAACENGWIKDPVCGKIDQVIIGCESGPGARECKIEWVRDLVGQCQSAGVAVFVKQLTMCRARNDKLIYYKTDNFKDFPRDLQIREYPKQ